ncbi:MAG TPA: DinB family protein [Candidatus Angelobacter sp.]
MTKWISAVLERIEMPRSLRILAVSALLISCAAAQTPAPAAKLDSLLDMQEFVQDWKISKQFTLDVAEAMPAEFYSFKPNPDEMTFGEQMAHIAVGNVFRFNQITGIQTPFAVDLSKPPATDKTSVMRMLEQSFDYVISLLPQITPEQLKRTWHIPSWKGRTDPDGRAMIVNMLVHTAHHRAQCEVYLRVKGIKPPDYTF